MKNKDKKNYKIISLLNYSASICFYIISIINFIKSSTSTGVVFLCLGSTFLCLGSIYLNKDRENKD